MAWAKWSEVVWKGLKTFLIQSPLYFKINKIKSWGKPGEVRFFSVSLVSKLSIDQSAFRIRPRSLRSWTSDFQKFNFRSEYGNFKLYFDWILVIDIQGWKSLPIFDQNFDILEFGILSTQYWSVSWSCWYEFEFSSIEFAIALIVNSASFSPPASIITKLHL